MLLRPSSVFKAFDFGEIYFFFFEKKGLLFVMKKISNIFMKKTYSKRFFG